MGLNNVTFIVFILFLTVNFDHTLSECIQATPCSCILSNGESYNWTALAELGHIRSEEKSPYILYFQPCRNMVMKFNETNSTECSLGNGVSLCALNNTVDNQTTTINLGTVEETKTKLQPNNEPVLMLQHERYTSVINLLCCITCNFTKLVFDVDPLYNTFNLALVSPSLCKMQIKADGLSTGSVLVILLFIFSGLYVIGGTLAMKFLRGATGWEMLPNHRFWSDLPSLVRDGIAFTFSCCKESDYRQI